jgi:hypothetical protein
LRREGKVIDLDKIAKYRLDEDDQYTVFMTRFVPCVAGLKIWTTEVQKTKHVSKVVTPSDEALGILFLMNSIDRWEQMYQHEIAAGVNTGVDDDESENEGEDSGNSTKNHPNIEDEENQQTSKPTAKPTKKRMKWEPTRFTMDCKKRQNKEFGGWNNEGRRMYNKLLDDIKDNRIEYPDWEKNYLHKMISSSALSNDDKRCKRKVIQEEEELVEAKNDLCFSDSESENDEHGGHDEGSCLNGPVREGDGEEDIPVHNV